MPPSLPRKEKIGGGARDVCAERGRRRACKVMEERLSLSLSLSLCVCVVVVVVGAARASRREKPGRGHALGCLRAPARRGEPHRETFIPLPPAATTHKLPRRYCAERRSRGGKRKSCCLLCPGCSYCCICCPSAQHTTSLCTGTQTHLRSDSADNVNVRIRRRMKREVGF